MTIFENLAISATFLRDVGGFVVIICTLIVLIYQANLLRVSVDAATNASAGQRQVEVDQVFVDNPGIRKYFLENVDVVANHSDYAAAASTAQLLANFFDTYFQQKGKHTQLFPDASWQAYIDSHIKGSPILRHHILAYQSWYSKDLVTRTKAEEAVAAKGGAREFGLGI